MADNTIQIKVVYLDSNGKEIQVPSREAFPSWLAKSRTQHGLSLGAVAESVGGVTRQAVHSWESGKTFPSTDNLAKLVALFKSKDQGLGTSQALKTAESSLLNPSV